MESLASLENWTLETQAVLNFPIIGAAGFFLFKLTGTVDPSFEIKGSKHDEQTDKNSFSLLRFTKNLLRLISVVAPILAISGYFYAAQKLIYQSIFTLGLASISILLFVIFREFLNGTFFGYENVTIDENKERVALSSIFIALLIILVNIPIVGLIWGAELSDLYEVWIRLNEGLPLGSARLTLQTYFSYSSFAIGYGLTRLFQSITNKHPTKHFI